MPHDAPSILATLSVLLGASLAMPACASSSAVGGESSRAPETETECLHAEGCCGGHAEGDASKRSDGPAEQLGSGEVLDWTIAPDGFAEINVELGQGASMTASFHTEGGDLRWNVHSHVGDEAVTHDEGEGASGKLSFTAPKAGLYSFLWVNSGANPVSLRVGLDLRGDARVHSKH